MYFASDVGGKRRAERRLDTAAGRVDEQDAGLLSRERDDRFLGRRGPAEMTTTLPRFDTRMRIITGLVIANTLAVSSTLQAQQKQSYSSLPDALQSTGILAGRAGPRGVVWIDGGNRFSFTGTAGGRSEIRAYDPATGRDTLLFSGQGLTFPGGTKGFEYESFQWTRDFKNLV